MFQIHDARYIVLGELRAVGDHPFDRLRAVGGAVPGRGVRPRSRLEAPWPSHELALACDQEQFPARSSAGEQSLPLSWLDEEFQPLLTLCMLKK